MSPRQTENRHLVVPNHALMLVAGHKWLDRIVVRIVHLQFCGHHQMLVHTKGTVSTRTVDPMELQVIPLLR